MEIELNSSNLGEEHYRLLIETIPHMVWMTDASGNATYFNHRALEHLGLKVGSVKGWEWLDLLHPADRDRAKTEWEASYGTGSAYRIEYRVRMADGGYRWFLSQAVPVRRPAGAVERWVGTWTDIDELKKTQEDLRRSDQRYRMLLDFIPDPVFMFDMETLDFISVNEAAIAQYGYTREEFLGMKLTQIRPPEDIPALLEALGRSTENYQQRGMWRHRTKDGKLIDVEIATHILELDGRRASLSVAHDVTELCNAQRNLQRTTELLGVVSDGSPDAIFIKDLEGRYLLCNPAAAQFMGRSREDVLGRADSEVFDRADAELIRERDRSVILSGKMETNEEELTIDGVRRIFLVTKGPYLDHKGDTIGVFGISRDITVRRRAEEELRLRDRAIQTLHLGILITDPNLHDNPIIYASAGFEWLTGYGAEEVVGKNCRFLRGEKTSLEAVARLREAIQKGVPCTVPLLNYRKDGSTFWNELSISPVHDDSGKLTHFIGVQVDLSSRRKLEDQLRQAQKMEAFGQLAGGVAHDFNNLLTIINGYSDLILQTLDKEDSNRERIEEIRKAGERSSALTRQLLAFSRKQIIAPRLLNLNDLVSNMKKMLRRVIGEDVELVTVLDPQLQTVKADPGQMEQVILNLAVNARDAMPQGGTITISTRNVELDPDLLPQTPGLRRGLHAMIAFSDTGQGMPEEIKQRVFEPFFTTKGETRGTGLGLSVVHGIIRQNEGHIEVDSTPEMGTCFRFYLPRATASDGSSEPVASPAAEAPHGTESILLAEDDEALRVLTRRMLEQLGYTVLAASNGEQALDIVDKSHPSIQILITDVVMPGMGGRLLAKRLLEKLPETKVLFLSGYHDDAVLQQGIEHQKVNFLQKPFTSSALAHKIRDVLAQPLG